MKQYLNIDAYFDIKIKRICEFSYFSTDIDFLIFLSLFESV